MNTSNQISTIRFNINTSLWRGSIGILKDGVDHGYIFTRNYRKTLSSISISSDRAEIYIFAGAIHIKTVSPIIFRNHIFNKHITGPSDTNTHTPLSSAPLMLNAISQQISANDCNISGITYSDDTISTTIGGNRLKLRFFRQI